MHLDDQEFSSGITVYDGAGTTRGFGWSTGTGCGLKETQAGGCATWVVSTVDRLPAQVAAVRYDLGDGTSTTVPTRDGYVVLNTLEPVPEGERVDKTGVTTIGDELSRVTYLDASGVAIAAQAFDGSGAGPDEEVVDGLPTLKAYPSLRKAQPIY